MSAKTFFCTQPGADFVDIQFTDHQNVGHLEVDNLAVGEFWMSAKTFSFSFV
jgi:hypothetical protein